MARSDEIIAASPDLRRLHEDGFELAVKQAYLLVLSIPHLTAARTLSRGVLIFPLTLATDTMAGKPPNHEAYFAGELPHYADGSPIAGIINSQGDFKLADSIVAKFHLSSKPDTPDNNYEVKVRRYVDAISAPARVLFPTATAQTRMIVENEDEDSPFVFQDTNSARAKITPITNKLNGLKIAIVGLGGTGSYVLDLVAKTPVKEIHLYDDDEYSLHNSYRSPGAPTREQLRARMRKVNYLTETYARMHKGIVPHPVRITASNVAELAGMSYIFTCIDPGPEKAQVVDFLVNHGIPFSDTGLGVEIASDRLIGMVNTITVTPHYKGHIHKIPVKGAGSDDLYASNIQIAELNMLNAVHAVIRWKKHFGFYADDRREHECTYTIGPNMLTNEEETGA